MYSPLLACCNGNLFWYASTTTAAVIPCKGTLDDSTLSLLPFPIDDSGQPLFSLEATPPHTGQVPIKEDGEEAVLADHQQSMEMASCPLLFPFLLPFFFLSPFQALGPASFLHVYPLR